MLERWLAAHGGAFDVVPPDAAAIAFVRYRHSLNSKLLADRLRDEESVLVVPGDHFGMDRFLRISFGLPEEYLNAALERIHRLLSAQAAAEDGFTA